MKKFLVLCGFALSSMLAGATTLTFDGTSGHDVTTYTEDGVTIVTLNPGPSAYPPGTFPASEGPHLHFDAPFVTTPHLGIHGNCCTPPYQFTFNGGQQFRLISLTLIYAISPGQPPATNAISTWTSDTGAVAVMPGRANNLPPTTFFFPDNFIGTSFIWDVPTAMFGAVDNIEFESAVPEPATWALLGSSLAVLGYWRRRRA
jgi:hypothetical protein